MTKPQPARYSTLNWKSYSKALNPWFFADLAGRGGKATNAVRKNRQG